jgi:hypothetical protein
MRISRTDKRGKNNKIPATRLPNLALAAIRRYWALGLENPGDTYVRYLSDTLRHGIISQSAIGRFTDDDPWGEATDE